MPKFRVGFKFEIIVWTGRSCYQGPLIGDVSKKLSFYSIINSRKTVKYFCVFVVVGCGNSKISCYI